MDQLPHSNEGFANNNLFADSHQYNEYDNLFQPGPDQGPYNAGWGINAGNFPGSSRAPNNSTPSWPQNANHLSAAPTHANVNGQISQNARSLSHSPAPYSQPPYNVYGAHQNFQYRHSQYDPTLVPPHAFPSGFNYTGTTYQPQTTGTIAPHALQHGTRSPSVACNTYDASDYPMSNNNASRPNKPSAPDTVDQKALVATIPHGGSAGHFTIINYDALANATKSERMGNFVNIGIDSQNWDVNRAALPSFVRRKSRNDLRKIAGNDPKLLAKLGKKSAKREKALAAATKAFQTSTGVSAPSPETIKYEGDSSSEEESSSDDEDSSYTSDDAVESSPLPSKRPDTPKEATEYDTIEALWRSKRKSVSSESIRKGLVDFWEIIKTIRDRWKADSTAVGEAESKNRASELPLLKSRVKDQRDMMESAFKTALKHGHRDIIELFSENAPLLYVCYQFLLDRTKADDYNSVLPRAILETMTIFTTLTDEKLEKTHLVKVLPRFAKKGDAKTQFYAKRIITNAGNATKDKTSDTSAKKSATKETSAASPVSKRAEPEPVAGVKRPASAAADGGSQKKVATGMNRANAVSDYAKQNGVVKKSVPTSEGAKPTLSTTAKPKQVIAKPSGLFSSLQSAAKKPGTSNASKAVQPSTATAAAKPAEKSNTPAAQASAPKSTFSFAETMANLSKPREERPAPKQDKETPLETPAEKAKRLKKEARRHLHVSFKEGPELVQIHVFHHDPEEELGHDASQMRDVADVGGEGRMFKQQHQMMDIDDEEESAEEEEKLLDFAQPREIDFSGVDKEERKRNYAPFGGGTVEVESAERAVREHYEANNLIVFYTNADDIPPNPREPSDPNNGESVDVVKNFGKPEDKYAKRAQQKARHAQQYNAPTPQTAPTTIQGYELPKISNYGSTQQFPQASAFRSPPQAQPPSNDAINNILASLKQATGNQATPPPPPMGGYGNAYSAPNMTAPQMQKPVTQSNGQPDLAAILAQITQSQSGTGQAPPMGGFGYNAPSTMPNMMGYPPQTQQQSTYENPERKQWRERGNENNTWDKRQNTGHNPYYKTKVCKYWQEGRCQKGDSCTYKHEEP